MSDAISGIGGGAGLPNAGQAGKHLQQNQTGGRSFESVLQQGGERGAEQSGAAPASQPAQTTEAQLEQLRLDHMRRVEHLPPVNNLNSLLPEFLDTRTRMGMLREVFKNMHSTNAPKGTDVHGMFANVEGEWKQLEAMWQSGKENLSPVELLGIQARLYQVSQHVEVLSKVVDQVTGGVKTILNTNV